MHAGPLMPVRTEDDVRTALIALEDRAPSAETVLRAVREAGARRRPGLARALQSPARALRSPRSPRWPQLVMGIATAAALAALTIALLPGGAPSGSRGTRPGRATMGRTSPGLPSVAALGRAMLTASTAATGDILYMTQTGFTRGVITEIDQEWIWPASPAPGQLARWRLAIAMRLPRTKPLRPYEDMGFTYTVPQGNPDSNRASYAYGHLTGVCYASAGQIGCGLWKRTQTPAGTWSEQTRRFVNPGAGSGELSPAGLAKEIAQGEWRIAGRDHMGRQPAIKLAETRTGHYRPLPTTLWVNARTHLLIRMDNGAGAMWTRYDWRYLKPTAANMASLRVPVPPGYHRSG